MNRAPEQQKTNTCKFLKKEQPNMELILLPINQLSHGIVHKIYY